MQSLRALLLCATVCIAVVSRIPLALAISSTLVLPTDATLSLSVTARTPADDYYSTPAVNNGLLFGLNGTNAPRLVVSRGVRLTFIAPHPIHPFYVTTVVGAGGAGPYLTPSFTSADGSSLEWWVDPYGEGSVTLQYGCAVHAYMGNVITVVYNASDPAQVSPYPPLLPPSSSSSSGSSLSSSSTGGSSGQCPVCPAQVFAIDLLPGVKLQWFIQPVGQAMQLQEMRAARALQLQSMKVPKWLGGGGGAARGSNAAAAVAAPDQDGSIAKLETQASKRLGHLSSSSQQHSLVPSSHHSLSFAALDPVLHPGSLYQITFTLTATDILSNYFGFVGIGFNSQKMRDCDLIACALDENGNAVVLDAWANDHAPTADITSPLHTDDIFNASATRNADGSTSFRFSRLLDTGDSWDGVLPTPAQNDLSPQVTAIIYSHGPASRQFPAAHGLANAGAGSVNFNTGASSLFTNNDAAVRLLHGITMLLTWLLCYPLGGFTARYLKHWSHWLRAHEFLQTTGTVGAISFAVMQMVQNGDRMRQWTLHGWLGIIITACLMLQVGLGQFSLWRLNTSRASWWHRPLSKVHKYLGIALVTGGPYQVYLGIDLLWPDEPVRKSLYFAAIGIIVAVFVTAESYKRAQAWVHSGRIQAILSGKESDLHAAAGLGSQKAPSSASLAFHAAHPAANMLPPAQFLSLPSLSWADVSTRLKAGAKLLVIREIVLDVRPFFTSHPGGRSTLEDSLGTDATQAFFGNDPDALLTHTHSAFAWRKLSSMAVGVLRSDADQSKDPKARRESILVASDGSDANREAVLAARRARRLNDLLVDARVVSKPAAGDAAHFRRYRIVHREMLAPSIVCLRMEQIPEQHPRPFLWRDYELLERRAEFIAAAATEAAAGGANEAKVRFAEPAAAASSSMPMSPQQPLSDATSLDLAVDPEHDDAAVGTYGVAAAAASGDAEQAAPFLTRAYVNLMNLVVGNQRQRASVVAPMKRRGSRITPASQAGKSGLNSVGSMVQLTNLGDGAPEDADFSLAAGSPLQVNPVGSALRQRGAVGAAAAAAVARSRMQKQGSVIGPSKIHWFQAGEHVELQGILNGDPVDRSYSPMPCYDDPAQLQIVFKVYPRGQLSQWLAKRSAGDYVKIRGPLGKPLLDPWRTALSSCSKPAPVLMIAGGAGVTPFMGFIHELLVLNIRATVAAAKAEAEGLCGPRCVRLVLLVFDRHTGDILLKDELDRLVKESAGLLTVIHSITGGADELTDAHTSSTQLSHYLLGRVSEEIILTAFAHLEGQKINMHQMATPDMAMEAAAPAADAATTAAAAATVGSASRSSSAASPDAIGLSAAAGGSLAVGSGALSPPSPSVRFASFGGVGATPAAAAMTLDGGDGGAIGSPPASEAVWESNAVAPGVVAGSPVSISASGTSFPAFGSAAGRPSVLATRTSLLDPLPAATPATPLAAAFASSTPSASSSSAPAAAYPGRASWLRDPPRVFMCGPIDFMRSSCGVLDDLKFDMARVECL